MSARKPNLGASISARLLHRGDHSFATIAAAIRAIVSTPVPRQVPRGVAEERVTAG